MLREIAVPTNAHREFIDITQQVVDVVAQAQVDEAICLVYSPHTTAAVTVNENWDPDVQSDLLRLFDDLLGDESRFKHGEGNSGAHGLTSLIGPSVALPISGGHLRLGQWQGIYLCELDGPRRRTVTVQILG